MQRWTAIAFLGALVAFVLLAFRSRTTVPEPTRATATLGSSAPTAPTISASAPDGPIETPSTVVPPGADTPDAIAQPAEAAPALASGTPRSVTFGAVLVEYRGAQGVPRSARTKEEALALAQELTEVAKQDFGKAVARGDKGSLENLGAMPRGVLEPVAEYALFSLEPGAVSQAVDSPRGFYIFKRIE